MQRSSLCYNYGISLNGLEVNRSLSLRYLLSHSIKLKALGTCYRLPLHVILPRTDLQEQAFAAGIETLARWLVELWETILAQKDDAIATVQRFTQHLLLLRRNGRAHEHTATLTACQPLFPESGTLLISVAAMDYDCHLVGDVEEEAVACHMATTARHLHAVNDGEELRILALKEKAARIVVKVVLPCVKLPFVKQDLVIVAGLEEDRTEDFGKCRRNGGWG